MDAKPCSKCGETDKAKFYWVDRAHSRKRPECISCTRLMWRDKRIGRVRGQDFRYPQDCDREIQKNVIHGLLEMHKLTREQVQNYFRRRGCLYGPEG